MKIHLVDGTYELFRSYFGAPPASSPDGREVGATRGFARSMLSLVRDPSVTHVGIAFDHVIRSFRNDLFDGYKTGEGVEPALRSQFELAEAAAHALGFVVWSMVEFEADDALAAAAARYADDERVEQVVICSPDKDLTQCVRGDKIVCFDRMRDVVRDHDAVVERFGVAPASIPDYLALVGDAADGIPGLPRWGAKSTATVLAHYEHIESIPDDESSWAVKVRGARSLATSLRAGRDDALLYRTLATLRTDVPLSESVDQLAWRGARGPALEAFADDIGDARLPTMPRRFRDA